MEDLLHSLVEGEIEQVDYSQFLCVFDYFFGDKVIQLRAVLQEGCSVMHWYGLEPIRNGKLRILHPPFVPNIIGWYQVLRIQPFRQAGPRPIRIQPIQLTIGRYNRPGRHGRVHIDLSMIVLRVQQLRIFDIVASVVPTEVVLLAHSSRRQLARVGVALVGVVRVGDGVPGAVPVQVDHVAQLAVTGQEQEEREGEQEQLEKGEVRGSHLYKIYIVGDLWDRGEGGGESLGRKKGKAIYGFYLRN
jgi:hypothetical protein